MPSESWAVKLLQAVARAHPCGPVEVKLLRRQLLLRFSSRSLLVPTDLRDGLLDSALEMDFTHEKFVQALQGAVDGGCPRILMRFPIAGRELGYQASSWTLQAVPAVESQALEVQVAYAGSDLDWLRQWILGSRVRAALTTSLIQGGASFPVPLWLDGRRLDGFWRIFESGCTGAYLPITQCGVNDARPEFLLPQSSLRTQPFSPVYVVFPVKPSSSMVFTLVYSRERQRSQVHRIVDGVIETTFPLPVQARRCSLRVFYAGSGEEHRFQSQAVERLKEIGERLDQVLERIPDSTDSLELYCLQAGPVKIGLEWKQARRDPGTPTFCGRAIRTELRELSSDLRFYRMDLSSWNNRLG